MRPLSLSDLFKEFHDERTAPKWFEAQLWADGERCWPHCNCLESVEDVPDSKPIPFRCQDCGKYFSLRTGTIMQGSNLSLRKWAIAILLIVTRPKEVSSIQLAKDLSNTQKTAWFLSHWIRKGFVQDLEKFKGAVEMNEVYLGGWEKDKQWVRKLRAGRRDSWARVP